MKYADIKADGDKHYISLVKLAGGRKIKDICGLLTDEGCCDPFFKLWYVVLDDGTKLWVEGEHDLPYLTGDIPGVSQDDIQQLYNEYESNGE